MNFLVYKYLDSGPVLYKLVSFISVHEDQDQNQRVMKITALVHLVSVIYVVSVLLGMHEAVHGRLLSAKDKPSPKNAAATARWLVSQNSWGVLK